MAESEEKPADPPVKKESPKKEKKEKKYSKSEVQPDSELKQLEKELMEAQDQSA